MKYSIATILTVIAVVAVPSVDAKKKGKSEKSAKSKTKNFIGDCSALSNMDFVGFAYEWEVDPDFLYAYPCSGGSVTNFAANDRLLKVVRDEINDRGRDMGINADCASLCDVDNGSFELDGDDVSGKTSIAEAYPEQIAGIFCDQEFGVLNNDNPDRDVAFNTGPKNDLSACRCDPDDEQGGGKYISGCYKCGGALKFRTKSCLDSSGFKKSGNKGNKDDLLL